MRKLLLLVLLLVATPLSAQQPVTVVNTPTVTANAGTNLNTANLDIALSALRDALTGAPAKTLADIVTALNSLTVSISGTVAATQSGTWTVQPGNTANSTAWLVTGTGGTFPVTGTFWQTTQPVSAATLPLPSLASTSTKQSDGTQKTQVVDGSGNVIGATSNALDINIKSGNPTTITATQATGTNLHTVVDSGTITTVGAVTSLTNALPAGTNAIGKLAANSGVDIGDVDVTSVSGNVTVIQGTGTNLHTVVDSGTLTAVTAITNALPAGSAIIGNVRIDQTTPGTTNAVQANAGTNLNTSLLALETTQVTGNSTLSSIKTDVDPFVASGAGGYVRQDSTATIAKESGGNLATIVTNTTGAATAANQILTQGTPGSAVPTRVDMAGAQDPIGNVQALRATAQGSSVVQSFPAPMLPLPPCNPVRRVNCSPKGF